MGPARRLQARGHGGGYPGPVAGDKPPTVMIAGPDHELEHSLVLYRPSARADDALRRRCLAARAQGRRVTVLALAAEERPARGCCDTRSVLWNRICRDLAGEHLARAAQLVDGSPGVAFDVLVAPTGRAGRALADEALARGADEIVVADPRASGLGRLELRRLRRSSPVPVSA